MFNVEALPGCCGVSVFHHFNDVDGTKWTFGNLARALANSEGGYEQEDFERPVVTFVHSSTQDNEIMSPRSFATWLTGLHEQVTQVEQIQHDRHGTRLTMYIWRPSQSFKERLFRSFERNELGVDITLGGAAPNAPAGQEAERQAAAAPGRNLPRGGNEPAPRNRRIR